MIVKVEYLNITEHDIPSLPAMDSGKQRTTILLELLII
jgi:hypothetical protein